MDLKDLKTKSDLPYPKIDITTKNKSDAMLLMNDYAGKVSETTAVMQYMYQHYIIKQFDEEIADIMEEIAITEMHHHEMLGVSITELGGDPIISSLGPFWSGSYVAYSRKIKQMLLDDIESEEAAIRNYKKTIMCLTDEDLKKMIKRIILDEEVHIQTFKALLEYVSFWK